MVTSGSSSPAGELGSECPVTSDTTPLRSTAQRTLPSVDIRMRGLRLPLLTVLKSRWERWGGNRETCRLPVSSNGLCSSSAKSFSDPKGLRKLKTLVLLFRRGLKTEPWMLTTDWRKKEALHSAVTSTSLQVAMN